MNENAPFTDDGLPQVSRRGFLTKTAGAFAASALCGSMLGGVAQAQTTTAGAPIMRAIRHELPESVGADVEDRVLESVQDAPWRLRRFIAQQLGKENNARGVDNRSCKVYIEDIEAWFSGRCSGHLTQPA
jgi:hypothetical protein